MIDYASFGKPDAPSGTSRELAERLGRCVRPRSKVPVEETLGAREARGATVGGHAGALAAPAELHRLDRGRLRGRGRAALDPPRRRRERRTVRRRDAARDPRRSGAASGSRAASTQLLGLAWIRYWITASPCRRARRTRPRSGRAARGACTSASSAPGQRARARSSASTPASQSSPPGVDAAEEDAVLEDRVDGEDAAVERDPLLAPVDPEQARDAAPAQAVRGCRPSAARSRPPRRRGRSCRAPRAASRQLDVARAHASTSSLAGSSEAVQTSMPSSRSRKVVSVPTAPRAEHERAAELPRLPAADRAGVPERAGADRGRLGEDARGARATRGIGTSWAASSATSSRAKPWRRVMPRSQ